MTLKNEADLVAPVTRKTKLACQWILTRGSKAGSRCPRYAPPGAEVPYCVRHFRTLSNDPQKKGKEETISEDHEQDPLDDVIYGLPHVMPEHIWSEEEYSKSIPSSSPPDMPRSEQEAIDAGDLRLPSGVRPSDHPDDGPLDFDSIVVEASKSVGQKRTNGGGGGRNTSRRSGPKRQRQEPTPPADPSPEEGDQEEDQDAPDNNGAREGNLQSAETEEEEEEAADSLATDAMFIDYAHIGYVTLLGRLLTVCGKDPSAATQMSTSPILRRAIQGICQKHGGRLPTPEARPELYLVLMTAACVYNAPDLEEGDITSAQSISSPNDSDSEDEL